MAPILGGPYPRGAVNSAVNAGDFDGRRVSLGDSVMKLRRRPPSRSRSRRGGGRRQRRQARHPRGQQAPHHALVVVVEHRPQRDLVERAHRSRRSSPMGSSMRQMFLHGLGSMRTSHVARHRPPARRSGARRSAGASLKTAFGCPAAAQISSKRNSSRSISVSGGSACASGATPPIEKPVRGLDEFGIGARQRPGDRGHPRLVDAAVARGDHQHRALVAAGAGRSRSWRSGRPRRPARRRPPARCAPPPRATAAHADGRVRPAPRRRAGSPRAADRTGRLAARRARAVSQVTPRPRAWSAGPWPRARPAGGRARREM